MPSPSTSSPPRRVRHGIANTSPARVVRRQLRPRHPAGEHDVARHARARAASRSQLARGTGRRRRAAARRPAPRARTARQRPDQRVLALARHQPGHADDDRPVGEPVPGADLRAAHARPERLVSTPGGSRTSRGPRPERAGASRRPHVLAEVGDHVARCVADPAQQPAGAPGSVAQPDLVPVRGRRRSASTPAAPQRRREQAERRRRPEPHRGAALGSAHAPRPAGRRPGSAAAPGRVPHHRERLRRVELGRAPARSDAKTTTEPAGWRIASSCTNAWMPPARGGKSLVTTSVRLTGTRPARCAATAR